MAEKGAAVGRVERPDLNTLRRRIRIDVRVDEPHVSSASLVEDGPGTPEGRLIHVDTHHRPLGSDQVGQLQESAEGTTADLDDPSTEAHIRSVKGVANVLRL